MAHWLWVCFGGVGDSSVDMGVEVFSADDRDGPQPLAAGLSVQLVVIMANGHVAARVEMNSYARAGAQIAFAVSIDERKEMVVDLEHAIFGKSAFFVSAQDARYVESCNTAMGVFAR